MNRNNLWIHIGIAVVIVTLAAVLGQIRRWETSLKAHRSTSTGVTVTKVKDGRPQRFDTEAEVMVRFRPGVTVDEIKNIAARRNDLVEDEIEAVQGLISLNDLDDADAEATARQYAEMSD